MLELRNLSKTLSGNRVVSDVSMTIADGEFFVLVGTSGSGKSTLLRLIAGLEVPDTGQVLVDGRDVTTLPSRDRNLGMVFQDYGLYPNMNVFGNIAYGLEARGMAKAEVEQRVREAAAKLQIAPLLDRNIGDISGGEQQRVALARAFAKDASVYLYDEPLSNLDPKLRHQARRDILSVHAAKGRPSLYVTHDQNEAFAMGNRIGVLSGGRLYQVGTADELVNQPANAFVARFIGSPPINIVEGRLVERDGMLAVVCKGISMALPDRWKKVLGQYGRERVLVGIRPTAIVLEGDPAEFAVTAENRYKAKIDFLEPLLGEIVVGLRLNDALPLTALLTDHGHPFQEGYAVSIAIDSAHICLFDSETQAALG